MRNQDNPQSGSPSYIVFPHFFPVSHPIWINYYMDPRNVLSVLGRGTQGYDRIGLLFINDTDSQMVWSIDSNIVETESLIHYFTSGKLGFNGSILSLDRKLSKFRTTSRFYNPLSYKDIVWIGFSFKLWRTQYYTKGFYVCVGSVISRFKSACWVMLNPFYHILLLNSTFRNWLGFLE